MEKSIERGLMLTERPVDGVVMAVCAVRFCVDLMQIKRREQLRRTGIAAPIELQRTGTVDHPMLLSA